MRQKSVNQKPSSERIVKDVVVRASPRAYHNWSKEFLEAGKHRLAGDTVRAATSGEVTDLRQEARA
jgi:hypothetical protein